jgi:hypothetical protein
MLISRVGLHGPESPPLRKRLHNKRQAQIDAERAAANWIVSDAPPDRTADPIAIKSWHLLSARQKPLATRGRWQNRGMDRNCGCLRL